MITMEFFNKYYNELVQFDKYLGMRLQVSAPGKITYTLEIAPHHLSSPDQCHGGVVSAMMDAVLGVTALSWAVSRENFCSTVEFKINYISTAKQGEILVGTADIDYTGATIITTSGTIREHDSGRLVAKGMGTFVQYPITKKPEVVAMFRDKM